METRYYITGDSAESIEDAKKVTVAQALNEQNKRITRATEAAENVEQTAAAAAALAASKQDTLIAGDNITISPENVISASYGGSSDIVIYDNETGAETIEDIALEIGAIYEMFITSATTFGPQYGQQKIVIRLKPREITPGIYKLYVPVHYVNVNGTDIISTYIHIYNSLTGLWDIESPTEHIKIFKIVKR